MATGGIPRGLRRGGDVPIPLHRPLLFVRLILIYNYRHRVNREKSFCFRPPRLTHSV